jgi:curved DNA-binding protein CbpA
MADIDTEKDYYATLGVLPSIDDVALAAVYRALLKKFHPDVFYGSKAEAERRTKEINEAYEVLGNSELRCAYDKARTKDSFGSYRQDDQTDNYYDDLAVDWERLKKYYPEAEEVRVHLAKLSPSLAFTFQSTVLEEKLGPNAHDLGLAMEKEFFERYFGSNSKIHDFVCGALLERRRDVAKEANQAIKIVGTPDDADTNNFIETVCQTTNYRTQKMRGALLAINKLRRDELSIGKVTLEEEIWLTKAFDYLKEIDGLRTKGHAYCILRACNDVIGPVYVQFAAPNYNKQLHCEAVSAESVPEVARILTSKKQRLLLKFGFGFPNPNYSQDIDAECDDDIAFATRLAFRVLKQIYDVTNFDSASFKSWHERPKIFWRLVHRFIKS